MKEQGLATVVPRKGQESRQCLAVTGRLLRRAGSAAAGGGSPHSSHDEDRGSSLRGQTARIKVKKKEKTKRTQGDASRGFKYIVIIWTKTVFA